MVIQRHVFGSIRGYTTLAKSAGVSQEDCRIIEQAVYGFGQTYDSSFYAQLKRSPTFFTRVFPGNRRGMTMVLPGEPDDQGRPTLRFLTAILTQRDWDAVLMGDLAQLVKLRELWKWEGAYALPLFETANPRPTLRLSRRHVPAVLQLLSHVERIFESQKPVIVSDADYGAEHVRAIEMLMPQSLRPLFTSACRAASGQIPANLVTVAGDESQVNFRPAPAPAEPEVTLSPYALALKGAGIETGLIPLTVVVQYQGFGAPPEPEAPPESVARVAPVPADDGPQKRRNIVRVLAGLLGVILALTVGLLLVNPARPVEPSTSQPPATQPATSPAAVEEPEVVISGPATQERADEELIRLRALDQALVEVPTTKPDEATPAETTRPAAAATSASRPAPATRPDRTQRAASQPLPPSVTRDPAHPRTRATPQVSPEMRQQAYEQSQIYLRGWLARQRKGDELAPRFSELNPGVRVSLRDGWYVVEAPFELASEEFSVLSQYICRLRPKPGGGWELSSVKEISRPRTPPASQAEDEP